MKEPINRYTESTKHFQGKSTFVDDIPTPETTLYAEVVVSPIANGKLNAVDFSQALALEGVERIITAQDIPGTNQIGDIVPDEQLLADSTLPFIGKPLALVLAASRDIARKAAALVILDYETLPATFDLRNAFENKQTFGDIRTFEKGNIEQAFASADIVIEGTASCEAQEHLYFETQVSLAIPFDGQTLKIFSASQNPSAIQKHAANVLNIPMNAIEVEVPRLGGAFGGKEEQAKPWALLAALGAFLSQKPVKLVLSREQDMCWTGKRHPYTASYKLASNKDGMIQGYEVTFLQDGGAVADLSTAVLERTLFHATNAYSIPHAKIHAVSCRTNHPSNTAFRGFGAPQAIFTIESALDQLANTLNLPRWEIQQKNLLKSGYTFPYGMSVKNDTMRTCWSTLWDKYDLKARINAIEQSNALAERYIKAIAITPLCFGIAFTATHLNQASVTINIYTDGSLGVAMSGVEMGQGLAIKVQTIIGRHFDLPLERIRIEFTNSSKTANSSPTAASVGADLNGMAATLACNELKARLLKFYNDTFDDTLCTFKITSLKVSWQELISQAYLQRIDLVSHAFYATPDLYFDRHTNKGHPFAYHVFGASAIEITLDKILGTYEVNNIDVTYDLGKSLNQKIDLGQMEGGLIQGIGYATIESLNWNQEGELLTNNFSTYKIPDLLSSPTIHVHFQESDNNPYGAFSSKAIGEPPLLLGLGVHFALTDAIKKANNKALIEYHLPLTPERVLLALYPD